MNPQTRWMLCGNGRTRFSFPAGCRVSRVAVRHARSNRPTYRREVIADWWAMTYTQTTSSASLATVVARPVRRAACGDSVIEDLILVSGAGDTVLAGRAAVLFP